MNSMQARFLLFLIGCIGTRTAFALLAKYAPANYLPYLGYLAIIPALGFLYIFATGARATGAEVFGERIWWNFLRPVHAAMYLGFAYNAINQNTNAWMWLGADVLLGLAAFLIKHWSAGDFAKLTQ
jgi:hypothetical protein